MMFGFFLNKELNGHIIQNIWTKQVFILLNFILIWSLLYPRVILSNDAEQEVV